MAAGSEKETLSGFLISAHAALCFIFKKSSFLPLPVHEKDFQFHFP